MPANSDWDDCCLERALDLPDGVYDDVTIAGRLCRKVYIHRTMAYLQMLVVRESGRVERHSWARDDYHCDRDGELLD